MKDLSVDSLRQQVERLIIENRNSLNDPTTNEPYDVKGIADDVVALVLRGKIEELKLMGAKFKHDEDEILRVAGVGKWPKDSYLHSEKIEERIAVLEGLTGADSRKPGEAQDV